MSRRPLPLPLAGRILTEGYLRAWLEQGHTREQAEWAAACDRLGDRIRAAMDRSVDGLEPPHKEIKLAAAQLRRAAKDLEKHAMIARLKGVLK